MLLLIHAVDVVVDARFEYNPHGCWCIVSTAAGYAFHLPPGPGPSASQKEVYAHALASAGAYTRAMR